MIIYIHNIIYLLYHENSSKLLTQDSTLISAVWKCPLCPVFAKARRGRSGGRSSDTSTERSPQMMPARLPFEITLMSYWAVSLPSKRDAKTLKYVKHVMLS